VPAGKGKEEKGNMTPTSTRERLPDVRKSITHKLVLRHARTPNKVERVHFYIVIGLYSDGRPAELFITVNGGSEMLNGWCKCWSIAISLCLQSGVTVEKLYEKFAHQDFELKGFTENRDIHSCSSVVDYVMSLFKQQFMSEKEVVISDNIIASEELSRDLHLSQPAATE
jgi:hypothetical protein